MIAFLMKVARIHQHGGPEVLVYEDVPEPKIKANQVLIRVRACALNHLDLFVRAGIPGMKFAMPHILGSDIAGEVVAVGELCERVKPGWRVLLAPGRELPPVRAVPVRASDNFCRHFTIFGYAVDGGNTELLAAPEYSVIQIPDDMSFEDAAAAPLVFLTAWHMLMGRARTAGRRRRAGAGGVERRRDGRHPDREAVPLPRDRHRGRRGESWPRRANSAPTT